MITPISQSSQPAITYTGIWVRSVNIQAPSPASTMRASILISPYDPISGSLSPIIKEIIIPDIVSASLGPSINSIYVSQSMVSIFGYVQQQTISQSLF